MAAGQTSKVGVSQQPVDGLTFDVVNRPVKDVPSSAEVIFFV
jgi:hypothetical protein